MSKIWLVAKREYLHNIKRKDFLIPAFGVPIFIVALMFVVFFVISASQGTLEDVGQVGYVDHSGMLAKAVDKPSSFVAYASEEEAKQALEDKTLGAYFVVTPHYLQTGSIQLYNYNSSPEALKDAINGFLLANLTDSLNTPLSLERVKDPINMQVRIQNSGRILGEAGIIGLFFTPLMFSVIFMMASQISSGFLMSGIVEEKTNRIMEILITSVTPMQMLTGKLIGLGALGLTQLVVWVVASVIGLTLGKTLPFLAGVSLPPDLVFVSAIYFLLGYFLMASIMGGLGAVAGSEEESRQYAGIFSIVLAIPFFAFITFITDPNGTVPTILSLIPFTAPLSMILRMSFSVVPPEQIILSIGIMLVTAVFIIWLSSRVFRWGLLMYGKRPTPRELWRVIRHSRRMSVGATRPQQET